MAENESRQVRSARKQNSIYEQKNVSEGAKGVICSGFGLVLGVYIRVGEEKQTDSKDRSRKSRWHAAVGWNTLSQLIINFHAVCTL